MNGFSLIKQINEGKKEVVDDSPLAAGIQYQQYELEVEGKERVINIPLREADNFEQAVGELKQDIDSATLKQLLRDFRGIRG